MAAKRCFFKAIILLIFCGLPLQILAKTISLEKMSVHNLAHRWVFKFYLSGATNYRTFRLKNPNRFVLDLKNVSSKERLKYTPLIGTPISDVRHAAHKDHIFRVVFDLAMPVDAHIQEIPTGNKTSHVLEILFTRKTHHVVGFEWSPEDQHSPKEINKGAMKDQKKKSPPSRDVMVVIDPGHGGKDPGATGAAGAHEKKIVLAISKILKADINRQPGFHAVLTRKGDYYISLRKRLEIARKYKADMFLAIHADAWKNRDASGASIFALSQRGATSEAARWLAARENQSELMGGVDLQDKSHLLKSVLINLSQTATIRSSLQIGEDLMTSLQRVTKLHHNRIEQAAFVVLKSPDIPSLLIETGFISNPYEERQLRTPEYQKQLAKAITTGVRQYFVTHPPRNTWLYVWRKEKKTHA